MFHHLRITTDCWHLKPVYWSSNVLLSSDSQTIFTRTQFVIYPQEFRPRQRFHRDFHFVSLKCSQWKKCSLSLGWWLRSPHVQPIAKDLCWILYVENCSSTRITVRKESLDHLIATIWLWSYLQFEYSLQQETVSWGHRCCRPPPQFYSTIFRTQSWKILSFLELHQKSSPRESLPNRQTRGGGDTWGRVHDHNQNI